LSENDWWKVKRLGEKLGDCIVKGCSYVTHVYACVATLKTYDLHGGIFKNLSIKSLEVRKTCSSLNEQVLHL